MTDHCPHCQRSVDPSARFCRHCGHVLTPTAIAPLPDELTLETPNPPLFESIPATSSGHDQWPLLRRQFWFYAAMLSVSVVMTITASLEFTSGAMIDACGAAGMVLVVTAFSVTSAPPITRLFRWPSVNINQSAFILVVALLWGLGIEGYFLLIKTLGVQFVQFWPDFDAAGWPWWAVFIIVCAVPGIFEEIAFRGVIYDGLKPILGRREALLVQAMGFAVLHLAPLIFVSHFCIGLGLGLLRDRTRGLWVPMLAHTTWNTYVIWSEWVFGR